VTGENTQPEVLKDALARTNDTDIVIHFGQICSERS